MLGLATLLFATAGSLLWGTGAATAQNGAPPTPSSCTVAQIGSGYRIVVNDVSANADRLHIRNNGKNREANGAWMGKFIGSTHGSRVIIERPDFDRINVQNFSVRALNGTIGSGYRYCGSITFPSLNCSVVANADGSNTITSKGGGGDIVYRNGEIIAGTVTSTDGRHIDSNDDPNNIWTRKDLVPGRRYHYSVDSVIDVSPKAYCGSVVARGTTTTQPLPTSHCFADDTPGIGIEVSWSTTAVDNASTNADRYVIQRRRNGGTWYWAGRVSAEAPSKWLDAGKGQFPNRFDYRVISQKNGVNSAPKLCGTEGF